MSKPPVSFLKTGGLNPSGETRYISRDAGNQGGRPVPHGLPDMPPACRIEWFESRSIQQQKVQSPQKSGFWTFGPSGETRTRGILVPNQAPYQLGHTRKLKTDALCFQGFIIQYLSEKSNHFLWVSCPSCSCAAICSIRKQPLTCFAVIAKAASLPEAPRRFPDTVHRHKAPWLFPD